MEHTYSIINNVLEKYFSFWKTRGEYAFSHMKEFVPQTMKDPSKEDDDEGYSFWIPIKSTTTESDIEKLELYFEHSLPLSYRYFLGQIHFIELHLGNTINFFSHKPGELISGFKNEIEKYYPGLIRRGFLPFGNYNDWGVACFNANSNKMSNNYEIIILDHDDEYEQPTKLANDFIDLFIHFNHELDKTIAEVSKN